MRVLTYLLVDRFFFSQVGACWNYQGNLVRLSLSLLIWFGEFIACGYVPRKLMSLIQYVLLEIIVYGCGGFFVGDV